MKIESDAGYIVKVGEPVCIADVKATSTSVAVPCESIPDGEYLVSLEVNGTAVAHRDTFSFASGSCTVGDYTLAYSSYAVTVSTTSNNDIVRLMIEPLKVVATDEFKAAVSKVAPKSEGGSGLPTPTNSDIGKVAMVVGEEELGSYIVPSQTAGISTLSQTEISGNASLFVEDAHVYAKATSSVGSLVMTFDGAVQTERDGTPKIVLKNGSNYEMTVLCDNGTFTAQITKSPSGAQIPLEWTIYVQAYEADIAWGMVSASGGRFVVTFTQDPRSEEWSTDKTFAECVAAWEAGKNLFSLADGTYYPMTSVTTESDEVASITFYMADAESQTISGYCIDAEGVYYYSAGE